MSSSSSSPPLRVDDIFAGWRGRRGGLSNTPPQNATSQGWAALTPRNVITGDRTPTLPDVAGIAGGQGDGQVPAERQQPPPDPRKAALLLHSAGKELACRIDALSVAFRVEIPAGAWEAWKARKDEAAHHSGGQLATEVDGVPFALDKRGSSSGYSLRFVNADATILVEKNEERDDLGRYAGPGWSVEVSLRAMFLATHTRAEAYGYARRLARAFGVLAPRKTGERVRRVDPCADVELGGELDFTTDDRGAFVGRSHRVADYEPKEEDKPASSSSSSLSGHAIRTFWKKNAENSLTGYSFSLGADFQARIYDKGGELARGESSNEKHAVERAIWQRGGWKGETVWRLEFQVRREALREAKIETLDDLEEKIDALWAYGTQKWLRLTKRGDATRKHRADVDARWITFQAVRFVRELEPLRRVRAKRGGPSRGQTIGTAHAYLAGLGKLAPLRTAAGEHRPAMDVFLENHRTLGELLSLAVDGAYLDLCADKAARFASVDDAASVPRESSAAA